MKATQIINEGRNHPIIVVDVQPAYEQYITFDLHEFAEFLNNRSGNILMYVNADETGLTDDNIEHEIYPWWEEEYGLDVDSLDMQWFDKGYGYLRGAMDQGVSDSDIIKLIREMYSQKVTDSRDLFGEDFEQLSEFIGGEVAEVVSTDAISIEWVSISQLKKFNGAYLTGGGRDECLKEIMLMMNAFNIKYKLISKYIY